MAYIQEPISNRGRHLFYWLVIVIIIGCLIAVFIGKHYNNPYHNLNNTKNLNASEIMTKRQQYSLSNRLEIDFYYLKGCRRCNSVAKTAVPGLQRAKKHHNLLVMNAAPKDLHKYLRDNQVFGYPTVCVRYHGDLIYEYTGMQRKIFHQVLSGQNPLTHRRFIHHVPHLSYRYNGYTQQLIKERLLSIKS